jgi:predicted transcriptional regulator
MLVGASTGLNVSRTATLLGFSRSTVSRVYQEWSTTQGHPDNLTQLCEALKSASLWDTFNTW